MATVMASRPSTNQKASNRTARQTSPRLAKGGKPRTKANAIPAANKVSGTSNNRRGSTAGNHAAVAPHLAPAIDPTASTAFTSRSLEPTPIGTSVTSGAMNLNANLHSNPQRAQSQGQGQGQDQGQALLHAQRTQQQQHSQQQTGGPPSTAHQQLHFPRSSAIVHQQDQHPGSPAQSQSSTQFDHRTSQISAEGDVGALQHQQQHQYLQSPVLGGNDPNQPNQALQYLQDPYPQQAGPFPVAEDGRVLMATAHMQRPYPNIYNTPQSHSPASVSSPHDAQQRALFAQPHAQMASSIYGPYPGYGSMSQVQPGSYAHHTQTQAPQQMSSQSLLMSHQPQSSSQMQHQAHTQSPVRIAQQSPRPKLEPSAMPLHRQMDQSNVHQSPQQTMNGSVGGPPSSSGGIQQSPRSGGGSSTSNAAPGPIPATTPVVVREDQDGAQWIQFEYSRDRVKMEYSIRCNVETVDLSTLDAKFKDDNCVYPRAMTTKDEYKGNRYGYETECNNVGWALASLNTCIRGKRGLIQRAVDSWRNSNTDQKLRSRRVRRQQKMKHRKSEAGQNPVAGLPSQPGMPRPNMPGGVGGMEYHQHAVAGSGADDGSNPGRFSMRPPGAYAPTMSMNMNGMGGGMGGSGMGNPHMAAAAQLPLAAQQQQQHHQQQNPQQHQVSSSSSSMSYPSQLSSANVPYGQMSGQHTVHYFSGGQP